MGSHGSCAEAAAGDGGAATVAATDPGEVSLVENLHLGWQGGAA